MIQVIWSFVNNIIETKEKFIVNGVSRKSNWVIQRHSEFKRDL